MSSEHESNTNYKIYENGAMGEVRIANEVVAIIAGIAATEVEGVAAMAGNVQKELVSKLGMKVLSKGVKIDVGPDSVTVELSVIMSYGYSIPDVSKQIQEKVRSAVESMTGLTVSDVNITVADVKMDGEQ